MTSIGYYAFRDCTSLQYIVLPMTVINIVTGTNQSFYGCPQLTIICLNSEIYTGYSSQTIYPSSFFTFGNRTFDYNGQVPEITYTFNGIGCGFQPTAVEAVNMEATAGSHSSALSCTFTNDDMSFDVEIPFTYTINPITLTAKANDASRLYGDGDPLFTSTYTGFVNNENEGVITSHGTYTTTATATSEVGTYAIPQAGATAQNYVFEYEGGTLTVNKAPLTMTANNKTMTYGSELPVLDASYEGLKNNETQPAWLTAPQFTTTATQTSKAGDYPITISAAVAKNYELTINSGLLTIEKAPLTVNVENKSRLYGDANPEFTLSYVGLKNNETVPEWEKTPVIETTATIESATGTYPITIADASAVNYALTITAGVLTVNKAALHVVPKDATRKYGEENPVFELLYSGLKNNESVPEWTVEPVISTTATPASTVGAYGIEITTAEAKNYVLEKGIGTLTITKAPLQVSINNYSRLYGEQNPTFGFSYTGLLNGETVPAWTELPTITTEATAESEVGEYAITATGGVMKNYETEAITPGVLTINAAALLIKPVNASRLYYEEGPTLQFTCSGFVNGDDESVLTVMPTLQTSATINSPVGVYQIEASGAEAKNYSISYEKGQLTISKRELSVSTNNYTRMYGEENPEFVLTYNGFVNNEDESVLLVKPVPSTEATPDSDTGIYDINIDNGVAENYSFKYTAGKLTIEKAYQTLTWEQDLSQIQQYSQVELMAEATSGLEITYTVEGAQICSIVKIGNKQYLDCFGEGDAVIVAVQKGNNNYWETTKIYKPVTIISSTGIDMNVMEADDSVQIYDLAGNRISKLQKGVNIVKMSDGKIRKMIVK